MPELPEVETIRRDLEPRLVGRRIEEVWTSGKALRLAKPLDVAALRTHCGHVVTGIRRRAKYLLIDTDDTALLVHLGMSGHLRFVPGSAPKLPHTHVVWRLAGGDELRYTDARRFGTVRALVEGEAAPELTVLGDEPLSLTTQRLAELAAGTRRPIKLLLLDQRRIAGVGNIYASEALFEARIRPSVPARRLGVQRIAALRDGIVRVLERGLANRGTTLRDYVDSSGTPGGNQHALRVYGREGEPCVRKDGGIVRRTIDAARSTFYCPRCQR